MRMVFLAVSLGVILTAGVYSVPQHASAAFNLQGTVPTNVSISMVRTTAASSLNLATNQTDLPIAYDTETSNDKNLYTVTMQSENASTGGGPHFASTATGISNTLPYSLQYGGNAVDFNSGVARIVDTTAKPTGGGVTTLTISYTGSAANLPAGPYSDTLTITITAK